MAIGINNLQSGNTKSKNLVYKDDVFVKFPNKNGDTIACILPSLDYKTMGAGPSDYLPYRDEENPDILTEWGTGLEVYQFIGKEISIISPTTFDRDNYDPVGELIKVVKNDPETRIIMGIGSDGKKLQNAYKLPDTRLNALSRFVVVNALVLFERELENKNTLLQIPATAFGQSGSSNKWGLLSELERTNRKQSKGDADSYYWGDITDPRRMIPCRITKESPQAGAIPIYNMSPIDEEEPVRATKALIDGRYNLNEVFYEVTEGEIIDKLIYYFSDIPQALRRAFSRRVPNIDKLLAKATSTTSLPPASREDDGDQIPDVEVRRPSRRVVEEDDDEEIKQSAPKGESSRSFEPDIDELPQAPRRASKFVDEDEDKNDTSNASEAIIETVPQRKRAGGTASVRDLLD